MQVSKEGFMKAVAGLLFALVAVSACSSSPEGGSELPSGDVRGPESGVPPEVEDGGGGGPEPWEVLPDLPPGQHALLVKVDPVNECGCGTRDVEEQPGSCGWYVGWQQVFRVRAKVHPAPEGVAQPVQKVELRYRGTDGGVDEVLDADAMPSSDGESFMVRFNIVDTPEGIGPFVSEGKRKVTLDFRVVAAQLPDGATPEPVTKGVSILVDVADPELEVVKPLSYQQTDEPYVGTVPYQVDAADVGSGLESVQVQLNFVDYLTYKGGVIQKPFGQNTLSGNIPVDPMTLGAFSVVTLAARDCVGNSTTLEVVVATATEEKGQPQSFLSCSDELAGYVPDLLRAGEGDKDGKLPDLLLCSSKGLLVSWGGPGGKHVPPLEVGIAGDIVDARFSDVTLDSHPDILVLVNAKGSVPGKVVLYRQVATSEGIGTRKYVMEEEWAVGTKPFSLEVADLEEDGRPDVVVADKLETQSVTLLRHSGKKPGQSQPQYWLQAPEVLTGVGGISWLSVVDVTLDGLPELVTAREDQGMVSVFVNLGKGNFPMAVDTVLVGSDVPFLDVADFDQDGYPDVAVLVEKVQAAYSLLGHGDGYFDPPLLLPGQTLEEFMKENISMILTPPAGGQEIGQGGALAYVGADSDSMVAGDFNLDGPADLAVCQESTGLVQFFHGTGTGEFTESLFLNVGQSPHSLVSGHFDGNDLPDFAVLNGNQCGVRFIYNYKKLLEGVPQDWCDGEAPGCVGEPSGGCQCKCMCHCPTPGNCWWKCGWVIEAGTACPDPSPCEQEPLDDLCGCDAKCKCSCTLSGSANCKWEVEHHVLQPECQGQPPTCDMGGIALDPDCGCATSCGCYCSVDGAGWCGWGYYWPYVGEEECEGSKKCAGQTCSGVGSCSGSGKPGQQCICKCGCDCDCKCKCMCGFGGNDSSCKWDCKSKCGWQCAWEDPPPPPPEMLWVTSGEIPMPVNPNTGLGRLKPLRVALDDFDLDGITDAVVALQSVQMEDCVDGVVKPSAWVKSVLFVSGAQSIAGGLGFSASKVEELGKEEITLLASARLDGDPFPDLVVATKHKGSICDGSSSDDANFDLMTGGHWVGWSVLGVPQGGCSWDGEVFPSPGGFRGSGGFEIEGEPRDVAVAQLEGLPAGSQDLIVLRGGSGTPGTPNYLPDAVGVYMAYGTDEAPECSLPLMTYLEQCAQGIPVDWTCQALSFLTAQCCSPSQEAIYPKLGLKPMAIEAEDMDNDGVLDVVVANQESNNIAVLFGGIVDSKYVLNPPGKASQLVAVGSAPTDVEAGDVDGDGWADLVVALAGKVAVSWGVDGKSFLTPAYLVGPGGGPLAASKVSVADLNFDGKQDLVVLSAKDSMIYLYYSAGDRKLIGPFTYGVGKGPVDLDVAELNGDGCLDLVVANEGSRTVTFIINGWCSKP